MLPTGLRDLRVLLDSDAAAAWCGSRHERGYADLGLPAVLGPGWRSSDPALRSRLDLARWVAADICHTHAWGEPERAALVAWLLEGDRLPAFDGLQGFEVVWVCLEYAPADEAVAA